MRVLLLTVSCFVTVVSAVGCYNNREAPYSSIWSEQNATRITTKTHDGFVQYGYTKAGADGYIAFTMGKKGGDETVGLVRAGTPKSELVKPDGKTLPLPCKLHLFENIDGVYKESEIFVEKDMLMRFLSSKPAEYSIATLLAFVEKEKKDEKAK